LNTLLLVKLSLFQKDQDIERLQSCLFFIQISFDQIPERSFRQVNDLRFMRVIEEKVEGLLSFDFLYHLYTIWRCDLCSEIVFSLSMNFTRSHTRSKDAEEPT